MRERDLDPVTLDSADASFEGSPASPRADFAIAAIYTLYVVPMAVWVLGLGNSQGHFWVAAAIAAVALGFLVMLWRQ